LVSGGQAKEEHDLLICKILCGYLPEDLVDIDDLPGETAEQECELLLQEFIAQWSILKKTSAGVLRETFFQRNGKLITTKNGEYCLIVETIAADILLDHLPWTIGMIKLPWMKKMLRVEWK
ncbi:MAG: hypothetical protein H7Y27_11500, partial [Gemmatimonadaceae bacterium]|nr:hypothetical protein [Chitinophagaceae bacterium]